jgi:tripartite-type tricarboxylate transporter receptor subunit TctC
VSIQRRTVLGSALALAAAAGSGARADTYPSKAIRFIVPFAAGGNADITARLVGEGLQRKLGQPVVVDNRPGAGGVLGQEMVATSPPDGYTLVIAAFGTLYVSPLMAGKPSMVPDFAPVSMLSTVPMVWVVPATSKYTTWQQFLAAAKAAPGTITVGHAGNGTPNHTDVLRVEENEKVTFSIVPYRGSGVGLNDVLASQIDSFVDQLSSSLPHLQSNKLRALLVLGEKRLPELPNVPTMAEVGLKPFDGGTTLGLYVRTGTPKPIIDTLNAATVAALSDPAIKQKFAELGATVRPCTPEESLAIMKDDDVALSALAAKGLLKVQ